jgi:CoA:oxalate CoA-transferase
MNRGKQSIVLDLKDPAAQATARAIALHCDVVVENFRPGVASRLGLGPELRQEKPALIYASISGFGQTGPAAHLPAYDLVAQAMSGLMAATGEEGGAPLKVGESYGDLMAGLYASWAILAALHKRAATGEGSTIDVAMFDALFSLLPTSHAVQFYAGKAPQRVGNRHPLSTPFGCFQCADGQAVIAVLGDRQWQALCALIARPDLTEDAALASDEGRTAQEPRIKTAIEAFTGTRPTAEVVALLAAAGIPTAEVQTLAEAAASPHVTARGLVTDLPHPILGTAKTVGQPVRFDGEKPIAAQSAPALGADGPAILNRLGIAHG